MLKSFGLLFLLLIVFCLSPVFAQTSDELPPNTKVYLENQIKEYEKLIKTNPEIRDYLRQRIVRNLIYLGTPPKTILKKVGKGFQKPEKKLYYEIAQYLVGRGEYLDRALELLRLEATVPYIWRGNDAYFPPCLWCIEAEIYFRQKQYQKVIELLEPNVPTTQSVLPLNIYFGTIINYKILMNSYLEVGRFNDALNLYLMVVSETIYPNEENRKILNEIYAQKYGNLDGLEEKIVEKNKIWKYNVFIKPGLVNIPAPKVTLTDIYGKNVTLSDFSGKVLVILFYPVSSNDFLKSILKMIENKNVVFIAIDNSYETWRDYQRIYFSVEQRRERILTDLRDIKPDFPILLADKSNFEQLKTDLGFMVSMIDQKGNIRFRNVPIGEPYFSEQLNYLLQNHEPN